MPFEPAGDRARWRIVYDLLKATPENGRVTYESLGAALDLDPRQDRHLIQMAVRRAAKEHEVMDNRALDSVRNIGYRVVTVPEHLVLARRHQKKAGKSLERGRSKVVYVDLSGVDEQTRQGFELVAHAFAMQADFNRRMDVSQKRLKRQVEAAMSATESTAEELAELRARLERLERGD